MREKLLDTASIETGCHLGAKTEFDISNPNAQGFVSFVLRHDPEKESRSETVGTWYKLTKAEGKAKRTLFEQYLSHLYSGESGHEVFHYRQGDFKAIPGGPWVYWITPGLRRLFEDLPKLEDIAQPRVGLQTSDNFRFLRFWWESGAENIGFGCMSQEECEIRSEKWFPLMKGGPFKKWYGNQEYCINYGKNGYELKAWADPLYGNSGWSRIIKSVDLYFVEGITWTVATSKFFSARVSPRGFIFDHAGNCVFTESFYMLLGFLNSKLNQYFLDILNPTISVEAGDVKKLPVVINPNQDLEKLVEKAISSSKSVATENETTFDFVAPPWTGSLDDTLTELYLREAALADIEAEIDEEVYRLYGISEEDRAAIEAELSDSIEDGEGGQAPEPSLDIDDKELAQRWISYAIGITMGRFSPGSEEGLGSGHFSQEVAERLRSLADRDGVATLDEGHQDDLSRKIYSALEIALGEGGANEVISTALGDENGDPERALRRHFERDFFKEHLKKYRKRPVYWLFQSPKKSYSIYVFHEKATRDTLPLILGNRYVTGKINQLKHRIDEVREGLSASSGREKKMAEKELEGLETALSDLLDFEKALHEVLEAKDERGRTVGWTPEIDDGVILNLAPLRDLMPSWKEPDKYWKGLEAGDYDWSYTAMRYWPDRVLEKCRANKSYAIAHDRLDVYEGDR